MAEPLTVGDPTRIGPYTVEGRLGAGGMGAVYLGRGPDGAPAAIKVVHPGLTADRQFRTRFGREIAAARRVTGPHLASVLDADPHAPLAWLATEHVDGPSLDHAVSTRGPLQPGDVRVLARELFGALAAVHAAGIVHRDVKPTNVLLGPHGAVLIDFGIAQAAESTRITLTGTVIGSPGYMSPEQAAGHEIGSASDVFSLAAVLLYAATGSGPHGVGSPAALLLRAADAPPRLDDLPNALRPLLEPCLSRDPAARPTAAALARDTVLDADGTAPVVKPVRSASLPAATEASTARRTPLPPAPPSWAPEWEGVPVERTRSRRWWWAVAGGAAAAVAAVVTTVALLSSSPTPTPTAGPPAPAPLRTVSLTFPDDVADVAYSPDGRRAYVAHMAGLGVVDTETNTVATSVRTRSGTTAVTVAPDGGLLYVALIDGTVQVLDAATFRAVGEIEIPEYTARLVASPDGRRLFSLMKGSGAPAGIGVIDLAAGRVVATVPTGFSELSLPSELVPSGDGSTVFVTGDVTAGDSSTTREHSVIAVRVSDATVVSRTSTSFFQAAVATAPGDQVYLSDSRSPFVRLLGSDGRSSDSPVRAGSAGDPVSAIAATPDGGTLAVRRDDRDELTDPVDAAITATGGADDRLGDLRVSPDGRALCSFRGLLDPTVSFSAAAR